MAVIGKDVITPPKTKQSNRMIKMPNQILIGYYHYYGITDNYQMMDNFRKRVIQILFFWMNRRSQRKSYTWDGFNEFLKRNPIVRPKIYVTYIDSMRY